MGIGWVIRMPKRLIPYISDDADVPIVHNIMERSRRDSCRSPRPEEEDEDTNLDPGGDETLLENVPLENHDIARVAIASGQGQRPLFILADEDAMALSCPCIFGGEKLTSTLTFSKIVRSLICRYDRRCARVDMLLWSYKYYELH